MKSLNGDILSLFLARAIFVSIGCGTINLYVAIKFLLDHFLKDHLLF
ncbi:hypothetical protein ATCC51561_1190 [Campylobacter concisus ATCC 51561]|nr:hypothetical protein ATCC51561_1190 [Campylobacter concisus ATCC 51561]